MSSDPASMVLASDDVEQLLANWLRLNDDILGLPLPALRQLIEAELRGKRRSQVLLRIYGRYNRLRAIADKAKLLRGESLWENDPNQKADASSPSPSTDSKQSQ